MEVKTSENLELKAKCESLKFHLELAVNDLESWGATELCEESQAVIKRCKKALKDNPVSKVLAEGAPVTYALIAPGCHTGPTESLLDSALIRAHKEFPAGSEVVPLYRRLSDTEGSFSYVPDELEG